jgi:hypothetical protein
VWSEYLAIPEPPNEIEQGNRTECASRTDAVHVKKDG